MGPHPLLVTTEIHCYLQNGVKSMCGEERKERNLSMICTYLRNDGSSEHTLEEGKVCTPRRKQTGWRSREPGEEARIS